MHVIKRQMVNYDAPRQYQLDSFFLRFILVRYHITIKLRMFPFGQTNFASYEESTAVP